MEMCNITEALSKAFGQINPEAEEVESIKYAEASLAQLNTLLTEPKSILKTIGIEVSEESQVQVTLKHRANRNPQVQAQRRRIIIIIIKWRNCDTDIIIIVN